MCSADGNPVKTLAPKLYVTDLMEDLEMRRRQNTIAARAHEVIYEQGSELSKLEIKWDLK